MSAKENSKKHPCLSCGACCAYFRVSFELNESLAGIRWKVPKEYIDPAPPSKEGLVSLRGTTRKHNPSCSALRGKVGVAAYCGIYESRPSPCRDFTASYEDGSKNARCDEARKRHGLRPIVKSDYPKINNKDDGVEDQI